MKELIKDFLPRMEQELGITHNMEDIAFTKDVVIAPIEQANYALAFIQNNGETVGIEVLCPPYSLIEDGVKVADKIQNMDGVTIMVNAKDTDGILYRYDDINDEIIAFTFNNWE